MIFHILTYKKKAFGQTIVPDYLRFRFSRTLLFMCFFFGLCAISHPVVVISRHLRAFWLAMRSLILILARNNCLRLRFKHCDVSW